MDTQIPSIRQLGRNESHPIKPTNWLIHTAIFVAGFLFAWITIPAAPSTTAPGEAHAGADKVTKRSVHSPEERENFRRKALLNGLLESSAADDSGEWEPGKLSAADYPSLLDELAKKKAGAGRHSHENWLFHVLFDDWHDVSPDAAVAWALGLEDPESTNELLADITCKLIINGQVAEATAFAEQYGRAQGRHLAMPEAMMFALEGDESDLFKGIDADKFARLMSLFTKDADSDAGNGSRPSLSEIDFADDFDFRRAVDILSEKRAAIGKGAEFSYLPDNLLSEWAKRDWNAAWQWALSGKELSGNDIGALVQGLPPTLSSDDHAELAAHIANLPDRPSEKNYRDASAILSNSTDPGVIAGFLEKMPGDRQQTVSGLLAASMGGGDPFSELTVERAASGYTMGGTSFGETLLTQMSAAERIAAFQSDAVRNRLAGGNTDVCASILQKLGHSTSEIQQMLPTLLQK